jgi:hypothetical protein
LVVTKQQQQQGGAGSIPTPQRTRFSQQGVTSATSATSAAAPGSSWLGTNDQPGTPMQLCSSCLARAATTASHLCDPEHLICNGSGGAFMHPTHVFSYARFASIKDEAAEATAAIYSNARECTDRWGHYRYCSCYCYIHCVCHCYYVVSVWHLLLHARREGKGGGEESSRGVWGQW